MTNRGQVPSIDSGFASGGATTFAELLPHNTSASMRSDFTPPSLSMLTFVFSNTAGTRRSSSSKISILFMESIPNSASMS